MQLERVEFGVRRVNSLFSIKGRRNQKREFTRLTPNFPAGHRYVFRPL